MMYITFDQKCLIPAQLTKRHSSVKILSILTFTPLKNIHKKKKCNNSFILFVRGTISRCLMLTKIVMPTLVSRLISILQNKYMKDGRKFQNQWATLKDVEFFSIVPEEITGEEVITFGVRFYMADLEHV